MFEAEKQTSSVFQELPWHYLEVAHVLLTSAKECFSSVKEHMEVLLRLLQIINVVKSGRRHANPDSAFTSVHPT